MKKLILVLLGVTLLQLQLIAQSRTIAFHFDPESTSGVSDVAAMESNISNLLSAINVAYIDGEPLSFSAIRIDAAAQKSLKLLWENMRFYCEDDINVSKCLHDFQGIQVRNISITLKPVAEYEDSLDVERELVVSLTRDGVITGVCIALCNYQYKSIMNDGSTFTDFRERLEILKFIEEMRVFYLSKDFDALRKLYSEDSLILFGLNMHLRKSNIEIPSQIICRYRTTDDFERLVNLIKKNSFIDVVFDHISILRHGSMPQYYGVTLHQSLKGISSYSVDSWLFMLWDFTDQNHPVIHLRNWQPDVEEENGDFIELNDIIPYD